MSSTVRFAIAIVALLASSRAAAAEALPTVRWDQGTLRLVERGGDYGRMERLRDGTVGCVFDRDGRMWIRHSRDGGATFGEPVLVAEDPDCWLTNADLLPLSTGELLYFWSERPLLAVRHAHRPTPAGLLTRPFLIRMSRSGDLGRTWSAPRTLYTAGPSYDDGCWEPAAVELPSGEVQVFFANEFPYRDTAEQEISVISSRDGGRTWGDARRASLRKGHRDGMPAPLLLAGGRVVVAIEDNGLANGEGVFKPSVVDAATGERWGALREPLAPGHYGGAPFLRQLPSGHTLLSFQESDDGTLDRCRMAVCVGDGDARNFGNKSYPLPPPAKQNQSWNSLFVKDETTVTAVTTATIDDVRGIWAIDGTVHHADRD